MAPLKDTRTTKNITQGIRKIDVDNKVYIFDLKTAIFSLVMDKLNRQNVGSIEFECYEDEILNNRVVCPAGETSGATTITLDTDDGDQALANMVGFVQETAEVFHVGAVSGDDLTSCTRGIGDSSAAAIPAGATITLFNAFPEKSNRGTSHTTLTVQRTNYIQLIRNFVGHSEAEGQEDHYARGKDPKYQDKKRGIEHARDIETALILGSAGYNSSLGTYFTGGLHEFVGNRLDYGGGFSLGTWFDHARDMFDNGDSMVRFGFAGSKAHASITAEAAGYIETSRTEKTLGWTINRLKANDGEVILIPHKKIFAGPVLTKQVLIVDVDNAGVRYMNGLSTKYHKGVHEPGSTEFLNEYRTYVGAHRALPDTHALMEGLG